jgi:hypothetical protein
MPDENEYEDAVVETPDGENTEDEIFDLFSDPIEVADDTDEDGDELDPKDGDSAEVLRTKLAARNQIIRQRDKAIKRMKSELEGKTTSNKGVEKDDIAQLISAVRGDKEKEKDPEMTAADLKAKFEEDPSMVIDLLLRTNNQLERKVAEVLSSRDSFYEEKISSLSTKETPQEIVTLAEKLASRPEYAGFSKTQLITVAKTLKPFGKRVTRSPATTSSRPVPMSASNADVEKVSKSVLEAMGYGDDD